MAPPAPPKTAADYAAVAVAPLLIFLMISSLASFLMLILYRGGHPQRVSWTLLMFTLGAVGIARVAIERDRAYALGYAGILGFVTFAAMGSFVDSPIFSVFILALIGYLADVIVRDCTLIDDSIDASGQGLMDSGRMFLKEQIQADGVSDEEGDSGSDDLVAPAAKRGKKTHQPGRTVMYLALAALPLFGLGQFFLRSDADTWSRALFLLAVYLFASLSLLVTTSFLGLRRYLRQRGVEMPKDVSVAWLGGGLAMIAAVLMIAYIAPLPGKALASFELPKFLDSPGDTEASRHGWGDEGADKSNPDAPKTMRDPNADRKEVESITPQEGAPAGDAGDGNREQGPAGKQDGGKQQQSGGESDQKSSQQGESKQQQGAQQSQQSKQQSGQQQSGQQQSDQQQSGQPQSDQQPSDQQPSDQQPSDQQGQQNSEQGSEQQDSGQQQSPQPSEQGSSEQQTPSESGNSESSDGDSKSQEQQTQQQEQAQQQPEQQSRQQQTQESSGGLPPEGSPSSPPSSSPGVTETIANALPMVASMLKFVIFLLLAGIVVAFVWLNRHAISAWWNSLFGNRDPSEEESFDDFVDSVTGVPPRAFASFRNPIGRESDLRRIVVITFQAFEAWTREHGTPRTKDETPAEFIRRIANSVPQMSAPASQVVDAYNRIVYGRGQATQTDLNAAEKVWQVMLSQ